MVVSSGGAEEREMSNLDPSVVALLEPLQDGATKNEIYTRIAMIRMRQSHILGNSEYAAKVLEDALQQATKSRSAHEMLGDLLRKLELEASNIKETKSSDTDGASQEARPRESGNDQAEKAEDNAEKESTEDDTVDSAEVERLKREVSEQSARATEMEKMLEERLMEELSDLQDEKATIRERQARHRKRIRSVQLAMKQIRCDERREKLQEEISAYFTADASSSACSGVVDCIVCCNSEAVTAVIPCGHLCLCEKCTTTIAESGDPGQRQCPLCRGHLLSTLKIYTAK